MRQDKVQLLRENRLSASEIAEIERDILSLREDIIGNYIRDYIYGIREDSKIVIRAYLKKTRSPSNAAQVLSEIPFIYGESNEFCEIVCEFATGVAWDYQDTIRVPAILSISRMCLFNDNVKSILRHAILDDNPIIRDSSAISIQELSGITPNLIKWGNGDGSLIDKIDLSLLD
jgi:hypothetical protein